MKPSPQRLSGIDVIVDMIQRLFTANAGRRATNIINKDRENGRKARTVILCMTFAFSKWQS
jgi:hypothetical protein